VRRQDKVQIVEQASKAVLLFHQVNLIPPCYPEPWPWTFPKPRHL
jgi:hypothetical protein